METLRVSATDIDALRFYLYPPIPEMEIELDELLRRLRRQEPPTPAMLAGTALHKALENAAAGEFAGLAADGYTFSFDTDVELDLPAIREMKATREYRIDNCAMTLVGKVDGIHGRRVDDHKLTERFDAEKYLDSYQWRIYLDVFGADEFRWNIFEARESAPQNYLIKAVHPLKMHRYPGMTSDVERQLRSFLDFARTHLPERVLRLAA
jgi:hypothetical protein